MFRMSPARATCLIFQANLLYFDFYELHCFINGCCCSATVNKRGCLHVHFHTTMWLCTDGFLVKCLLTFCIQSFCWLWFKFLHFFFVNLGIVTVSIFSQVLFDWKYLLTSFQSCSCSSWRQTSEINPYLCDRSRTKDLLQYCKLKKKWIQ